METQGRGGYLYLQDPLVCLRASSSPLVLLIIQFTTFEKGMATILEGVAFITGAGSGRS